MSTKLNWQCPYCSHKAIIHDGENGTLTNFRHEFSQGNKYGYQAIRGRVIVCPNDECKEYVLRIFLHDHVQIAGNWNDTPLPKKSWRLIPDSMAKVFPSYIPRPILDDYQEACSIVERSPKASATLSRRCLQGIIRDFWGVSKPRLIDEIDAIQDKLDAETHEAIDSVRRIGNIGAHMERDINVIIDVEPEEAAVLIGLIETLLSDWYVARFERQQRMSKLRAIADAKDLAKKGKTA
jgi:hypothetical protein